MATETTHSGGSFAPGARPPTGAGAESSSTCRENPTFSRPIPADFDALVWMLEGEAAIGSNGRRARRSQIAVLGSGAVLPVADGTPGTSFMLMAAKPYGERPMYNGPYVD